MKICLSNHMSSTQNELASLHGDRSVVIVACHLGYSIEMAVILIILLAPIMYVGGMYFIYMYL